MYKNTIMKDLVTGQQKKIACRKSVLVAVNKTFSNPCFMRLNISDKTKPLLRTSL